MNRHVFVAQIVTVAALLVLTGCDDEGLVGAPPTFTEIPGLGLTGVDFSSLAWGDADNDGDLDLAVAGQDGSGTNITKVYENVGGVFDGTELAMGLTGIFFGSLAWGDADNDGDLDLAVAGYTGSVRITKIYENVGGAFDGTELATSLAGVYDCSLAWGDADNDGDLDLAVAGHTGSVYVTTVYENVGGAFDGMELATGLTLVASCSLAWGDADNDGDLDLAVAGWTGSVRLTKVYENVGGAVPFDGTELATALTGVSSPSLAWGDTDNDGDLDLAIAGYTDTVPITKVYQNVGGAFDGTELATGLTGVWAGSLAWGDADNDGDLDLAVTGYTGSISITKVHENIGGTVPSDGTELVMGVTGAKRSSVAWGDVDNDGDLDLAVAGYVSVGNYITNVYENDGPLPNTPPDAPMGLAHLGPLADKELFVWTPTVDAETPAKGLSYSLMIRDASGLTHCYPAMADETTGHRRVPALGPTLWRGPYTLFAVTLAPGDYEARVQAIDSGFEGGPWSEPCVFNVP